MSNSRGEVQGLPWLIWVVVIFGSISSTGFGFDSGWWSGIMTSAQFTRRFGSFDDVSKQWALTSQQQSLGTGLGYLGIILGLFCGAPLTTRLGRKKTLWIQSFVAIFGIIIEATTKSSYVQFIIGKLVVFFSCGIATSVIPTYQGECAPQGLRGLMSGAYNAFLMIGGFASTLIVYLCRHISSDWSWRIVIVAQVVIPFISWISLPFLPESPHWLISQGRLEDATVVIRRLRGPDFPAESEVALIQQELLKQRERNAKATWVSCVEDPVNRRRTFIAVGTQILQQAQGISFVANYQAVFLQRIGFKEVLLMSVVVYIIGIVANLVGMALTDKLGRRIVMLWSATLLGACMLIIGGLTAKGSSNMTYPLQIASTVMFVLWFFVFQISWGPLAWVITAEVPASQVREKMVALSGLSAYLTGLVIVFVDPYTQAAIGGSVAFIYGAFSIVSVIFVWFFVPELRQRSLEQIDEMFRERLPTRAFKTHVCRIPADAASEKPHQPQCTEAVA
ncbi:unnamed protein product [Penicillium egyptiacum]|uniref:Major facilitator superfamily (MFS) profile domain-containing protein n=1 Tax=Penicillium egyptiacum TaxID=1303716 RepID=A0A9W4P6X9_9EURO|nr:unnamed protein product [Penicillium egyptiacum]